MPDYVWSIGGILALGAGLGLSRACAVGMFSPSSEIEDEFGSAGGTAARIAAWVFILPCLGLAAVGGVSVYREVRLLTLSDQEWVAEAITKKMKDESGIELEAVELKETTDHSFEGTARGRVTQYLVKAKVESFYRIQRSATWTTQQTP